MATDSFTPAARIPAAVKSVEIVLRITNGTPKEYAGRYSFDVLDAQDGIVEVREGNLVPHLTAAQITAIKGFLDAMLAKAKGSVG
jgi:hypothetical protein